MVLITSDAASNSIIKQAEELKARVRNHASRFDENFKVGVEIEICLSMARGHQLTQNPLSSSYGNIMILTLNIAYASFNTGQSRFPLNALHN